MQWWASHRVMQHIFHAMINVDGGDQMTTQNEWRSYVSWKIWEESRNSHAADDFVLNGNYELLRELKCDPKCRRKMLNFSRFFFQTFSLIVNRKWATHLIVIIIMVVTIARRNSLEELAAAGDLIWIRKRWALKATLLKRKVNWISINSSKYANCSENIEPRSFSFFLLCLSLGILRRMPGGVNCKRAINDWTEAINWLPARLTESLEEKERSK